MKGKNLLIGGLFLITAQLVLQSCSGSNQLPQLGKDKIETVIAAMTPEEKIGMTVGDGKFLPATDPKTIEQGLGIIIANQNSKMVIPRLSIMTSALTDGPSGVNRDPRPAGATDYSYTTAFPTSTCLAATWNTEMLEIVGKAFGNEVLEYEYDVVLMPALNLHRNPKCGRNFEYYSEDPLLSGKLSASIIRGLQSNGIGATLKHFLANNQETNRASGFHVLKDLEDAYSAFNESIIENNLVPDFFNNPKMLADNGIKDGKAPAHFNKRLIPFHDEMMMTKESIEKQVPNSDIAVITLGRSGGENYENGYIPASQIELNLVRNVCEAYHAAGKKVVVVLNVGGVCETGSWRNYPDAILLAWQPGQEGGYVDADVLKGAVNPSGKLPTSFPLKYEDVPSAGTFPGESQQLSFDLEARSLASFWSGISAWVADKGNYEVRIGASSKDIRLKSSFNLPKDIIVEKVHDVMYPNFAMKELSQFNKQ